MSENHQQETHTTKSSEHPSSPEAVPALSPDTHTDHAHQLQIWLAPPTAREQRRFLENHCDLLDEQNETILHDLFAQEPTDATQTQKRREALLLLQDAQRRGGTVEAVREAYVNLYGGFVLDLPPWLETVEQRLTELINQNRPDETAEIRLELLQEALEKGQEEVSYPPELLATLRRELADAWCRHPRTDNAQALETAINFCEEALHLYTAILYPYQYAKIQNSLGYIYRDRIVGERRENIEQAITCCNEALRIHTLDDFPLDYARIQNNLGGAYQYRIVGEQRENIERAIACLHETLRVYTLDDFPLDYARAQNNLGVAYRDRIVGEQRENIEQAIACLHNALRIHTLDDFPFYYARAQNNLGIAYWDRIVGERRENIEQAIDSYHNALRVFTLDTFPFWYAATQNNQGEAYILRIAGEQWENIEQAIACYQEALRVWTFDTHPIYYATAQYNLGEIYQQRIVGERSENIEQAIVYLHEALRVKTLDAFPSDFRGIRLRLAEVEAQRENWNAVRDAYTTALEAEDLLAILGTGTLGRDAILKEGRDAAMRLGYALHRLGDISEAAIAMERGRARGQTIPVTPIANANTIAFLGASASGPASGNATLTYTDGSTSTFTLAMSDWTLNGGAAALASGNSIAFTTPYRNSSSGNQLLNTYLFYTETALVAGKTLQSITLPTISQGSLHIFSIGTRSQQVPTFNNVGTSDDSSPGGANFDGAGSSYSAQALQTAGLTAGKQISRDGIFFTWPNVPSGSPNNYLASGQVLPITPVANAVEIGFLGASAYSNASGTALITYADGSTQTITLGFTDWGVATPAFGNTLVASPAYYNTASGKTTNRSANVYFSEFALQTGKMVKSVTLPTALNQGQMHIFATGTRSYFNNIGISDNANPSVANFDTFGASYSSQEISDPNYMNWQPCDDLNYFGMDFTWPCVSANTADNYQAQGQTIPVTAVANADTIGFVGAASNGPSSGTAVINYTDGSTQSFTLGMSDWTMNAFKQAPSYRNRLFASLKYQNAPGGQQQVRVFIFYAEQKLQPNKTVQSVTLPSTVNQGQMHIFSIATGAMGNVTNNVGVSLDEATIFSSYDNGNQGYSEEALKAAGITPGQSFFFNGTQFNWTESYSIIPDNYVANGQTIPVTPVPNANTLAFVGAAAYGSTVGLATITYTDGSTQSFTLGFTDWYSGTISYNNLLVANMPYHNTPTGKVNSPTYLYYADTSLQPGKTIQSVTLPATTSSGEMHIFSIGTRGPSPYNNVGITDDADPIGGNYDGSPVPGSWSAQALQSVGITPGANLTYNGVNFTWPSVPTGAFDNYQANGQVIPVTPVSNATSLAFLGSATYGPSSGTGTITYTDGSTQTFTLSFPDWSSGTTTANDTAVAIMPYVNIPTGRAPGTHYLYYTETSLQAGKVIKSVTLPISANQGALHVFAIGTRAGVYYNNVGTSDDSYSVTGSFDNQGGSYSAQALQAAGIVPGQTFYNDGIAYSWPGSSSGTYNNYMANGQTIPVTPVANAVKLGFLGASTYAGVSGIATINYTDGSSQPFTLGMSDWQLSSNTITQPSYGNQLVATTAYTNSSSGKQSYKGYIFSAEVDLQAGKTIQSVTLPISPNNSFMHIFSIGTRGATLYNNVGISDDAHPQSADFDSAGNGNYVPGASYSDQALQAAGLTHGKAVTYNGVTFTWPNVSNGQYDNYQANGQTVPVTPVANATTLAFLGSATNGSATGTGTITYTDGSTQSFSLGLTDWAVSPAAYGNLVVATMPYRNTPSGKQGITVSVFYTDVTLQTGKTVQSVTLPSFGSGGQLHVFAIGTK